MDRVKRAQKLLKTALTIERLKAYLSSDRLFLEEQKKDLLSFPFFDEKTFVNKMFKRAERIIKLESIYDNLLKQ